MESRKDITNEGLDVPLEAVESCPETKSTDADMDKNQLEQCDNNKIEVIDVEEFEDSSGSEMEFKIPRPKYVNLAGLTFDIPEKDTKDEPLVPIPDPNKPEYDIRRFYYSGFQRSPPSSPSKKLTRKEQRDMFTEQFSSGNSFSCTVQGANKDMTLHNRFPDYLGLDLSEFSFIDPIFPPSGDYTLKEMISNFKNNVSSSKNELATSRCQSSNLEICPDSSESLPLLLKNEVSVSLADSIILNSDLDSNKDFPSVSKIEPIDNETQTFISKSDQFNSLLLKNDSSASTSNIELSVAISSSIDLPSILKTEPTMSKTFDESYLKSLSSISVNELTSKNELSKCDSNSLKNIPSPLEEFRSLEDIEPSIFEPSILKDDISIYLSQKKSILSTTDNVLSSMEELFSNFSSPTLKDELSIYLNQPNAPNNESSSLEDLTSIQELESRKKSDTFSLRNGPSSSQDQTSFSKDEPTISNSQAFISEFAPVHLQTLMSFLEDEPLTTKRESPIPKSESDILTAFIFTSKSEPSASKRQFSFAKSRKRPVKNLKLPKRQPSSTKNKSSTSKNDPLVINGFSSTSKIDSTFKSQESSSKYDLCPTKEIPPSWPKFDTPTWKDKPLTSHDQSFILKCFSSISKNKQSTSESQSSISISKKCTWDDYELPKSFPSMPKMKPLTSKCDPDLLKNSLFATEDGQIDWEKFDQAILKNEPSPSQNHTSVLKYDPSTLKIFTPRSKVEVSISMKEQTDNVWKISTQLIERVFNVIDNPNYFTEFASYLPNYKTESSPLSATKNGHSTSNATEEPVEDEPYSLLALLEGQELLGDEINPCQLNCSGTFQNLTVPPDEEIKAKSERTGMSFNEIREIYSAIVENNEIRKMLNQMTVENALTNVNPISKFENHEAYLEAEKKFLERAEELEQYNLSIQALYQAKKKKTKRSFEEKTNETSYQLKNHSESQPKDRFEGLVVGTDTNTPNTSISFVKTEPLSSSSKPTVEQCGSNSKLTEDVVKISNPEMPFVSSESAPKPTKKSRRSGIRRRQLRILNEMRQKIIESKPVYETMYQPEYLQHESQYQPEYQYQYLYPQEFQQYNQQEYQVQYYPQNQSEYQLQNYPQYQLGYMQDLSQQLTLYQPVNQYPYQQQYQIENQLQEQSPNLPYYQEYDANYYQYQIENQLQERSPNLSDYQQYGANYYQYPTELIYSSNYNSSTLNDEPSNYWAQPLSIKGFVSPIKYYIPTLRNGLLNSEDQPSIYYDENVYKNNTECPPQNNFKDLVEPKRQSNLKFPSQYEPCPSDDARCRLLNQTLYRAPIYTHKIPGGMPQVSFQATTLNSIPEERNLEEEEEQKWTTELASMVTKVSVAQDVVRNAVENTSNTKITFVRRDRLPKTAVRQSRSNPELSKEVVTGTYPEMTVWRTEPSPKSDEKQTSRAKRKLYWQRIKQKYAVEDQENASDRDASITTIKSKPTEMAVRQSGNNLVLPEDVGKIINPEMISSSNDPSPKSNVEQATRRSNRKKYRRRNSQKLDEENEENIKKKVTFKDPLAIVFTSPNSSPELKERNTKNLGARPKLQPALKNAVRENIEPEIIQSSFPPNQEKKDRRGTKRKVEY